MFLIRSVVLTFLLLATRSLLPAAEPPAPLAPIPSAAQLSWQQDELALYVFFGINTFTGRGIGLGNEDPRLFNPPDVDCNQWARVAKETGFKTILLTAKHYDGFCLWPTATTSRSVKSSTWKGGRGDVVKDLSDACREHGLGFGIACSLWDRSQESYASDPGAYARLYRQQLEELLTNYGPLREIWFDGNRANISDWPGVVRLARRLQPDAVLKQGPRLAEILEDVRWVGNEDAMAPLASWSVFPPPETNASQRIWFPVECNTLLIGHEFWDGTPPRSLHALLSAYYTSVGRNATLLVKAAANKQGKLSEETVRRLQEFHQARLKIFGTNLATGGTAVADQVRGGDDRFGAARLLDEDPNTCWATDDGVTSAVIEIDLGPEREFNVVRMEENISLGQRVAEYRIDIWDAAANGWKPVNRGMTIGYRKLDRFPAVKSSKVRLGILRARGGPVLHSIGVHLDTVSPPEHFLPEHANAESRRPQPRPTN